MTSLPPSASLTFNVSASFKASRFGPRIGDIKLNRGGGTLAFQTPALVTWTSRGVVPHLSRDHSRCTRAIRWLHVPFESFLDQLPPVPTLQTGPHPLHTFLGFRPSQHVLSMSARDPSDEREMPPNGNDHISARCVRGVRKLKSSDWRSYVLACKPDVIFALSDSPFTQPPHSQKRLTKSIARSTSWLADLLRPIEAISKSPSSQSECLPPLNIFVHMAGGASIAARAVFSEGLTEILHGKEADDVKPLKCLDDGVAGYVFDFVPLRSSLLAESNNDNLSTSENQIHFECLPRILPLLEASLTSLPSQKLRLVNSPNSPHEILRLIQHIGIDLFDTQWAQQAADIGVAFDFRFPVAEQALMGEMATGSRIRKSGKLDLGHNLFDPGYSRDFSGLANSFLDGLCASKNLASADGDIGMLVCPCAACSPVAQNTSPWPTNSDRVEPTTADLLPPFTRAYIHHLLHTHEMTSYALLTMHNLEVLDSFFAGVRSILALPDGLSRFSMEVEKFVKVYDEEMLMLSEARVFWNDVDMARGKGRLARTKGIETETDTILNPVD